MTNVDENGIHFGVIDFGDIKSDVIEEILWHSKNTRIEHIKKTIHDSIVDTTLKHLIEMMIKPEFCETILNEACNSIMEELIDKGALEEFDDDVMTSSYEDVEMQWTVSDNEIFITKSPVTSMCRLCSPCFPNAGDLSTRHKGNVKTYDIPPEWENDDND